MGSHTNIRTIPEGSFSDTFSALHLLRSYNNLITPNSATNSVESVEQRGIELTELKNFQNFHNSEARHSSDVRQYNAYSRSECSTREPEATRTCTMLTAPLSPLAPAAPFSLGGLLQPPLLAAMPPLVPAVNIAHPFSNASAAAAINRNIIENAVISSMHQSRRPRSEKKPIPDDQKDDKYYERRRRNNQAAKKSRDARKIREDHIALRATVLEHENAILRAQVVTLREECQSLRQMLIKQRMPSMQSVDQLADRSISSSVTLTPADSITSLPCQV